MDSHMLRVEGLIAPVPSVLVQITQQMHYQLRM